MNIHNLSNKSEALDSKALILCCSLLALATPIASMASTVDESPLFNYSGVSLQLASDQEPSNGRALGWNLHFGMPLGNHWALEPSLSGSVYQEANLSGTNDTMYTVGVDAVYALSPTTFSSNTATFQLRLGGGLHHNDVENEHDNASYAQIGAGVLFPLADSLTRVTLDWRYQVVFGDNTVHSDNDERISRHIINLGLQFGLGERDVKRVDCNRCDIDEDGVSDGRDYCKGSIPRTVVDMKGCASDQNGEFVAHFFDADIDGVADDKDQCPDTLIGQFVDSKGCPAALAGLDISGVTFASGSNVLSSASKEILDRIVPNLMVKSQYRVEVQGHTDSLGSPTSNVLLSQSRAHAVRDYLVSQGVPHWMLTAHGYGSAVPISTNDNAAGRENNRRVMLVPVK